MSRTIKELALEAVQVQDACNLSGVVHSFARALTDLREHVPGNDQLHNHVIVVLWVDKIDSLTNQQSLSDRSGARASCAHDIVGYISEGKPISVYRLEQAVALELDYTGVT